jgi:hypothetical protein
MLLDLAAELQPEHLEILREIESLQDISGAGRGVDDGTLETHLPALAPYIRPLVARLSGLGLVQESARLEKPTGSERSGNGFCPW